MNTAVRSRLNRAGWRVGTAEAFLKLSREEAQLVEIKLALGDSLKRNRARRRLTQGALAARLGSSQSRIAKAEAGVGGVTLDLLFRALLATGLEAGDIAREMLRRPRPAA